MQQINEKRVNKRKRKRDFTHDMKKVILYILLLMLCPLTLAAQSSMSDEQVLEFVMKENAAGTSQAQIVTKLMQRGVNIQQIRRIKDKYERQTKRKGLGNMADQTVDQTETRMRATDAATYYGAFQFTNGADVENEYVYDANGNMTQDFNKKNSRIEYNSLNLPSKLQFCYGHMAEYTYDGAGRKLSVAYTTSKTNLLVPMVSIVQPQAVNVAMTLKTDYCGNIIYENGKLTKILTDVGYITLNSGGEPPMYHYFLTDHLGNNCVVVQENGAVEQINHYYAFGGLMGDSSGDYVQPYKYNGKELDRMHGLDWYDYGARHYDAALGRWMCMDPLTEKYYDVSPYAYCGNNPVNAIDEEGKKILFVNGYYNSLFKSLNMGPSRGSEEYWSTNFI